MNNTYTNGGIDMFGLGNNKVENAFIEVKKLRKPKLRGAFSIGLFIKMTGFFDNRNGLFRMDGEKICSPWISRRQSCYNRYSSEMYKTAGEIMKPAYIQREKINDGLKKYKKELEEAKVKLLGDEAQTMEQKRKELYTKRDIKALEEKIIAGLSALKEIKIAIEEAEHELNQILQEKKLAVESQILIYIRGAGKMSEGGVLLVENEISRTFYNSLGNGFEYNLEMETLLGYEEKECVEDEHIQ